MRFLHLTLYRWILIPLAMGLGLLLSPLHPKLRDGFRMRRNRPWLSFPKGTRPFWIHASSGELEYAKPLIRRLKQDFPESKILLTYYSPSVQKAAAASGADFATPLPWDHPFSLKPFLRHHKPRALFISRTDTWPELLYSTHMVSTPITLFSYTLSSTNSKLAGPFRRAYFRWLFSLIQKISCVSQEDADNLRRLGSQTQISVDGDTRYDQVLFRLSHPKPLRTELTPAPGSAVFVMGSTWPEDEAILLPALPALVKTGVRPIVVPHEPSSRHIEDLEKQLKHLGLKTARYSTAKEWHAGDVLLIDQIGILAELYLWARFAFVGNSCCTGGTGPLHRHRIHSVMEPLAAGCLTLFGPHHHNNREALEFKSADLAREFQNSEELVAIVQEALSTYDSETRKQTIRDAVQRKTGATEKIAQVRLI